jgi:hypothetical protein
MADEKIAAMMGQEITVSSRSSGKITWKVTSFLYPLIIIPESEALVWS